MTDTTAQTDPLSSTADAIASAAFLLVHSLGLLVTGVMLWTTVQDPLWQKLNIVFGLWLWVFMSGMGLAAFLGVAEVTAILRRRVKGQSEQDLALRLRVLLYVLVAWAFLNVFLFSFRISLMAYVSLSLAYGAYTYWTIRLPQLRQKTSPRTRRIADAVGMNVTLTLLIAEIALRGLSSVWPAPILVTDNDSQQDVFAAYRPPAGASFWGFRVNEGGFYDTEFLPAQDVDGRVVVSIGDSFSTWVMPHAFHFTTVAEEKLPETEIYNMGYSAIGPLGYLLLLVREALPLEPDAVIINLFVGNDLIEGVPERESRWYDTENFLVAVVWQRVKTLMISRLSAPESGRSTAETREELIADYPHLGDPLLEDATFDRELFLNIETERAEGIAPANEATYQRFFTALDDITRAAGDTPLAFMLIPDEFQIDDELWEEVVTRSAVELDRDYPQHRIIEWLQRRGYPYLDLLPVLRATPRLSDGKRHVYKLQDTHFNTRGNEVAGKALARFVDNWLADINEQSASAIATASAAAAPTQDAETRVQRSLAIVQAYAALLADIGFDGSFVVASARLDPPKEDILAAAVSLSAVTTDSAEREGFIELARTLAFFQPGVGDVPSDLDQASSSGDSWRSIVETAILDIEAALFDAQQ